MTSENKRVREVFREVFDDDQMEIWDEMGPEQVPDWDSLSQVKLIVGLEEEFGVKFNTQDVQQLTSVGEFKRALRRAGIGP